MSVHQSIRRLLLTGSAVVALLVVGVGGWAGLTEISGAIIAPGALVVDSHVKEVQHPTGGIVAEIRVRNGDRVKANDILVRLDDTIDRANLAIVARSLDELMARKSRLLAERDGVETIVFPPELTQRAGNADVDDIVRNESRLFDLRRLARIGQKDQLAKRIEQLQQETEGYQAQITAKSREIELIKRELVGARELWDKKLMPIARLTEIERSAARIEGERGHLIALLAQSGGKLAEVDLQILQIELELKSEVGKELRELEARFAELVERKVTAEDRLRRIDIRAPLSGRVHQSMVHTVEGVIAPGSAIMLIVPDSDNLIVEAKIAPHDIDQIYFGQEAGLRFSAFNHRATSEINGSVSHIAADVASERGAGEPFYVVRIAVPPEEIQRLGDVRLMPGMPVETFIRTDSRKVISYLVKPLHDQIARAFREQ